MRAGASAPTNRTIAVLNPRETSAYLHFICSCEIRRGKGSSGWWMFRHALVAVVHDLIFMRIFSRTHRFGNVKVCGCGCGHWEGRLPSRPASRRDAQKSGAARTRTVGDWEVAAPSGAFLTLTKIQLPKMCIKIRASATGIIPLHSGPRRGACRNTHPFHRPCRGEAWRGRVPVADATG